MSRKYVVFGSNDGGKTLVPLGIVDAKTHEVAKLRAEELDPAYESYGSATARNFSFQEKRTKTIVAWVDIPMGQLTFDDLEDEVPAEEDEAPVVEEQPAEKKQKAVEEAKREIDRILGDS